jgi:predicted P-loop ATPase
MSSPIQTKQQLAKDKSTYLWSRLKQGQDLTNSEIKYIWEKGWGKYSLYEWEAFKAKNAIEWNSDNETPNEKVKKLLEEKYVIQTNELTGSIEIFYKENGKAGKNTIEEHIYCKILDNGWKFRQSDLHARIVQIGFDNLYNPINDYFNELPDWDGEDYIQQLASCLYVKKAEYQDFWEIQFKKSLVRSLACTLKGVVNRYVMTLVGAQNGGKTSFIRFLNPWDKKFICQTQPTSGQDKDNLIHLSQNFIWLFDDLDVKPIREMGYIKSLISADNINVRKPYAKETTQDPRRVNFWATSNNDNFLNDHTGSTRWLCFEFNEIDYMSYTNNAIDVNKIWSQAMHLLKTGFYYQLTKEETALQSRLNGNLTEQTFEEIIVSQYFLKLEPLPSCFMSIGDIMNHIAQNSPYFQRCTPSGVKQAFQVLGFTKGNKSGFYAMPKTPINESDVPF